MMGKNRKTSSWMACLIVRSGPLGASFDAKFYHTLRWNERLASCWSAPRLEFQDWLQPPACRRRQSKSLSRKNTTLEVPHMPHCRLGLWKESHHRVRSKPNSSPEPIFELPSPGQMEPHSANTLEPVVHEVCFMSPLLSPTVPLSLW